MTGIKVDLLIKDALIYELQLRNHNPSDASTVSDLRKFLRQCIKQNVTVKSRILKGKMNVNDELETIANKLSVFEEKQLNLSSDSKPIDIVSQNARINHCCSRINGLTNC